MTRKYEALIVLDTKGKEESADQLASQITRDMEQAGLKLEQVDNLGKRKFPYAPRHVESGHFVAVQFEADAESVENVRNRLKLNDNVYQQYYQRRA